MDVVTRVWILLLVSAVLVYLCSPCLAAVTGPCGNCHTMHNSQDGQPVDVNGPQKPLLKYNCLGCHSDSGSDTLINSGSGAVPIVFNHAEPTNPLAGGNFYWVEHGGDQYGHNVVTQDATLTKAPGNAACTYGCHISLANITLPPSSGYDSISGMGCIGCHDTRGAHHASGQDLGNGYRLVGVPGDGTRGFRFIAQAGEVYVDNCAHTPPCVMGIEAPWDVLQNPTAAAHNEYQDAPKPYNFNGYGSQPQGISDFCAGCHQDYHAWPARDYPNGGDDTPWIKHPAGVEIPATGEYASYTTYDPAVPVGRPYTELSGMTAPLSEVRPGQDKVMCLSCHFAHAGPYPDALRWNYDDMVVNSGNTGGCFRCHTTKN